MTACTLPSDRKKFEEKGVKFFDIENLNTLRPLLDIKISDDLNLIADNQSTSAYLPIMSGCDNFCTYCAVPHTRGQEKSRPVKDIVADFKRLLVAGRKEITLLGQNVNSFRSSPKVHESKNPQEISQTLTVIPDLIRNPDGTNLDPCLRGDDGRDKSDFAGLLRTLNNIDGDFTIKFLTNHPKDLSDELIEAIATLPKVAKSIHLPLQSGSNKILKAMNRHYTAENYLGLVKNLKSKVPKVEISTDIIVGFPGETDEDFLDTVDVAKKSGFAVAYIAMYSPRPGTAAAKFIDNVPLSIKKSRFRTLDTLINNSPHRENRH